MLHKIGLRQSFELLQFLFQAGSHCLIDTGTGCKEADYCRRVGTILYGPATDAGMGFVKDLQDPVIVDVFYPLPDLIAAAGTGDDIFGQ
jgi:hypothetical protein